MPGYKAGGPITSIYQMVQHLHTSIDFSMVTRNTDWHDPQPYAVDADQWISKAGCRVKYLANAGVSSVWKEFKRTDCEILYFNGIYSPTFNALPLLRSLLFSSSRQLIVAPRGMLNPNAIALKSSKKRALLSLYRFLGIEKKVKFHSTSEKETQAILSIYPKASIKEAMNVPAHSADQMKPQGRGLIAVGRISPVKNTLPLLELMNGNEGIPLTLVGTSDDEAYLKQCTDIIERNDHITWRGGKGPEALGALYQASRFFISMTTGENFGHAIIEALSSGLPVIISDRTPWIDLEKARAGWVIPLEDTDRWRKVVDEAGAMDDAAYSRMSSNALAYVKRKFDLEQLREQYLELFGAKD